VDFGVVIRASSSIKSKIAQLFRQNFLLQKVIVYMRTANEAGRDLTSLNASILKENSNDYEEYDLEIKASTLIFHRK
jgi:hypothetical protein